MPGSDPPDSIASAVVHFATAPRHDSDLVLSAIGSHGITEAAALKGLAKEIRFRRVGGGSAGAMNAAGLALGLTPEHMVRVWTKLLTRVAVDDWKYPGLLKPMGILHGRGGCIRGEEIRQFLKDAFGNARLGDVELPLRLKVGSVLRRKSETLFSEVETHKRYLIANAVLAALAMPLLFDSQRLDDEPTAAASNASNVLNDLYCDVGFSAGIACGMWDDRTEQSIRPTTVIRMTDAEAPGPARNALERLSAFARIARDAAEDQISNKPADQIWDVHVPTDGNAFDFSLTTTECSRRERMGDLAAARWIDANTPK